MSGRFVFRLDPVLRLRLLREREALRRVAACNRSIARLDALDAQVDAEVRSQQAALAAAQAGASFDPLELARARTWISLLRRQVHERRPQRDALQQELRGLQQELRDARTQRRTLEQLRERRQCAYKEKAARSEQTELDEAAQNLQLRRGRA